ncbi:hypothetical protein [Gorillibacterium sp. CAU 1737]|uniref:hypothetical protein n=1 Tax=Gorillibacterium sp. CAU 1737 TaxID=3140362 RepID=UPI0032606783
MRRIALGIIIIAALILVACNHEVTNNAKTYADETHKELHYGKLIIYFDDYHLVSDTRSDNTGIFTYKVDKGRVRPETNITLKVRSIEKQDFPNTESILSYLGGISPDYERIRIYKNVTDDSGIIGVYSVTVGRLTNYVVYYRDAYYFVESDSSMLDMYLFKNDPTANYEVDKRKIQCADSYTTHVRVTTANNENDFEKAEYEILQGKDGAHFFGEINRDENRPYRYHFTLKNEKGENRLALSTYGEFYDVIEFIDANRDGYADIRFLEEPGTFNNSYALYVWDESANNFVKVQCDEMLSEFEVHDGYLLNWQKADYNSGVIQKLVWDQNTLLKESEKHYQAD